MLICRPVCRRSSPQKIRTWIREMEQMRQRHSHDAEACRYIDHCIRSASQWLSSHNN
jgi:hypothetical protein